MAQRCRHDPARALGQQPIFASLSGAECAALVDRSVCRAVRRGEQLFREGERCRGLHVIVEGAVRVYRANSEGQEQVLGVLGAGDSLGDVSLFDEGPYLASAWVVEKGRVIFVPFGEVQALYRMHPEVARAAVRELAERVRSLVALVDQLALQDVPTRVACAVLRYARESRATDGSAFRLPRTQEELAAELGTTREGVSRALRGLRSSGVIGQRGARVQVLDSQKLEQLAGMGATGVQLAAETRKPYFQSYGRIVDQPELKPDRIPA